MLDFQAGVGQGSNGSAVNNGGHRGFQGAAGQGGFQGAAGQGGFGQHFNERVPHGPHGGVAHSLPQFGQFGEFNHQSQQILEFQHQGQFFRGPNDTNHGGPAGQDSVQGNNGGMLSFDPGYGGGRGWQQYRVRGRNFVGRGGHRQGGRGRPQGTNHKAEVYHAGVQAPCTCMPVAGGHLVTP